MNSTHDAQPFVQPDALRLATPASGRRLTQTFGLIFHPLHNERVPLPDDGDTIRGLGYVALYAAYLEEQIDDLLFMLYSGKAFPEAEQRWPIGRKIEKAKALVADLTFEYREELLRDLTASQQLFAWRNEVIHGRIYANFNRPDTLKSGRPNVPEREITAAELYDLANSCAAAQAALYRPMIFQLPHAINNRK